MPKSIYIVAGEMSGDAHGAGLIRSLQETIADLKVHGSGGGMIETFTTAPFRNWIADAAVMGIWEVLKHYGWFKDQFAEMFAEVKQIKPDVLLLVDYPGFNLRFAKAVREVLPQTKILYYISPQVWAWNKGRIPKMAVLLDEMMCLFPFEEKIFSESGLKTTFVGHPLVDELEEQRIDVVRSNNIVGLFPGSREREVARLFPMMLGAVALLAKQNAGLQFEAPAAAPKLAVMMRRMLEENELSGLVKITDGGSHHLMQKARCGVIASGTATLEAAYYGLPYCLVYKVAWPTYLLGKILVKIEHIGLVNILAGRTVVKEFIQRQASPELVAAELHILLDSAEARLSMQQSLAETAALLGGTGAHERAATVVAGWLMGTRKK